MRASVWNNFIERLPADIKPLASSEIEKLSSWQMNGREIKNVINMAVAWSRKRKEALSVEMVQDLISLVSPMARRESETDLLGERKNRYQNGTKTSAVDELRKNLLDL